MLTKLFLSFLAEEDGQDLVEYCLLATFTAFAAVTLLPSMSEELARLLASDTTIVRLACAIFAVITIGMIVVLRTLKKKNNN